MKRDQVIAFRLAQNHLTVQAPNITSAAEMGIRITNSGTVPIALGMRLKKLKLEDLDDATLNKKTLVEVVGPRAAGFLVPSKDISVFTRAIFPEDDRDLERLIGPTSLKTKKIPARKAIEVVTDVMLKVLDRRALTQDEIHAEWRRKLPKEYLSWCRGCKTNHVGWAIVGAVSQQGLCCYGPIKEGDTAYVRTDQWLGKNALKEDLKKAKKEIVRRYLKFFGPSTVQAFAAWSGTSAPQAKELWSLIEPELMDVEFQNKTHWILSQDYPRLESPPEPEGVLLLPPYDPFLDLRDRELLLPDKKTHSKLWRILGNPGALVLNSQVVGIWRTQKKGDTLEFKIEAWQSLSKKVRDPLEPVIERIRELKGCKKLKLSWV